MKPCGTIPKKKRLPRKTKKRLKKEHELMKRAFLLHSRRFIRRYFSVKGVF